MILDDAEMWWLLYCCGNEQRYRNTGQRGLRRPVSAPLGRLIRRLELEAATSSTRQELSDPQSRCEDEDSWIGSDTAASWLGWTTRQVQRRAGDLEGRKVSPRKYLFPAAAVRDYAEALTDGRSIA